MSTPESIAGTLGSTTQRAAPNDHADLGQTGALAPKAEALLANRWLLTLLALLALVSTVVGLRHSVVYSFDFQWPAATLLAHGVDPWTEALQSHRDLTNSPSVPNYLHELYVLYLPLTLLPEQAARVVWALVNAVLTGFSLRMLCAIYSVPRRHILPLVLFFVGSVCFRSGLGVGQFCFAELFVFCLLYRLTHSPFCHGISLGVSMAKYSFSPLLVFTWLFRRRFATVVLASIPVLIGLGICMMLLHQGALPLLFEPLLVARHGVSRGFADVMTLGERLAGPRFAGSIDLLMLLGAALYGFRLSRKRAMGPGAEFACVAVATLLLFKHLIYDYVFLLPPLLYAVWGQRLRPAARLPVVLITTYVWYGSPLYIGRPALREIPALMVFNCLCIALLLLALDLGEEPVPPGLVIEAPLENKAWQNADDKQVPSLPALMMGKTN